MSYTIKADIVLFEKALAVSLKHKDAKGVKGSENEDHKYSIYDTSVQWDKKNKKESGLQWVRDKFKNTKKEDVVANSFTLSPGYELKITTIPGLNIQLEKPISIKFNRFSVAGEKGGRFFPEKLKEAPADETTEAKDKREANEKNGIPFKKFDFEIDINLWGEKKKITASNWKDKDGEPDGSGTKNQGGTQVDPTPTPPATPNNTPETDKDTSKTNDGVVWWKADQKLSGLHIQALGFEWKDGKLCVLLNASVTLAGLKFGVMGLQAKVKPATMFSELPEFDLQGMEFGYYSDSVSVGAALLKEEITFEGEKVTQFMGAGLLKISKFDLSIYGVGAYAKVKGQDSLFLYFGLNKTLGGPPFFTVKGLSIGFGFNRSLQLDFENMEKFPLVKLAFGDKMENGLLGLCQDLAPYIPPAMNSIFIMAGVRFDTFKVIESFALFVVYLDGKFNVDLFIISRLTLSGLNDTKYIFIELKIKGALNPSEGFVKIKGGITDNSFIISKDIKITGGFAFYAWWKDEAKEGGAKAGDFVLTVGGYHPRFKVPEHYPQVPRLSLKWEVSDNFKVYGEIYFALTPRAIMAGLDIGATYKSDNIKMTFKAGWDFLVQLEPFYYEIDAYIHLEIEIYISVTGFSDTIHIKAGANLHISGPEFSMVGEAYLEIDLGVKTIRLTAHISVGEKASKPAPLTWTAFKTKMLPEEKDQLSLNITEGVIGKLELDNGEEILSLNREDILVRLESAIPANELIYNGKKQEWKEEGTQTQKADPFYIGLMGDKEIDDSQFEVRLQKQTGKSFEDITEDIFDTECVEKNLPGSLWDKQTTDINATPTIKRPVGLKLSLKKKIASAKTAAIPISELNESFEPNAKPADNFTMEKFEWDDMAKWIGGEKITNDNAYYAKASKAEVALV